MKFLSILIINFTLLVLSVSAQQGEPPCSSPEAAQFDFWLGDWTCEWTDQDGNVQKGSNRVEKILGSCVVQENFDGTPAINLIGKSYSLFDRSAKVWKQTWVDNNGIYLDFEGSYEDDKMILSRKANIRGKEYIQRMVWYDIKEDAFMWNWERSEDNGETWLVQWKLHYKRKS